MVYQIRRSILWVIFIVNWMVSSYQTGWKIFHAHAGQYITCLQASNHYAEDLLNPHRRILVALTMDSWKVGRGYYTNKAVVYKLSNFLQQQNIASVEMPMWGVSHSQHFDAVQELLNSFWIPDLLSTDAFILNYDLVIIPDSRLAKYMMEAYFVKNSEVKENLRAISKYEKSNLFGNIDAMDPSTVFNARRYKDLKTQRNVQRKLPPTAVIGYNTYNTLKGFATPDYFGEKLEDFILHLPASLTPRRKVLLMRYGDNFGDVAEALRMKGYNVTSLYPIEWMKRDWTPQEDRFAKEVDVVYFHEKHHPKEWLNRYPDSRSKLKVACHDKNVALEAKRLGFERVFYALHPDLLGLANCIGEGIACVQQERGESELFPKRFGIL